MNCMKNEEKCSAQHPYLYVLKSAYVRMFVCMYVRV